MTNLLTVFDKEMNYQDTNNFNINGKFVFFGWGNKINEKEFLYIYEYAKSIYMSCVKMQKKISFVFKKTLQQPYSEDHLIFLHPTDARKLKNKMPNCIDEVFKEHPPKIVALDDLS